MTPAQTRVMEALAIAGASRTRTPPLGEILAMSGMESDLASCHAWLNELSVMGWVSLHEDMRAMPTEFGIDAVKALFGRATDLSEVTLQMLPAKVIVGKPRRASYRTREKPAKPDMPDLFQGDANG